MLNKKAFTLIEIIIVLAIISILMSMGLPQFSKYRKNIAYKSANKMIVAVLQRAKSSAMTTRLDHYVVFAPDLGNRYSKYERRAMKVMVGVGTNNYQTVEEWIFLPPGVYFSSYGTETLTDIPFPFANSLDKVTMGCIKFNQSTGKAANDTEIRLAGYEDKQYIRAKGQSVELK